MFLLFLLLFFLPFTSRIANLPPQFECFKSEFFLFINLIFFQNLRIKFELISGDYSICWDYILGLYVGIICWDYSKFVCSVFNLLSEQKTTMVFSTTAL